VLSFSIPNSGSKKPISSNLKYLLAAGGWFLLIDKKVVWFLIKFISLKAAITVVVILTIIRASFSSFEKGVEEAEPLLLFILELTD